jgi:hypothetical protein
MATTINNVKLKKCNVNGVKCRHINVNGVNVWNAESILFSNGATEDSGTWTGYKAYAGTAPTIGTYISYPYMNNTSFFGSLASCETPITLSGSHTLSFDMTKCEYALGSILPAVGSNWGVRIYALFSKSKIALNTGTVDTIAWAEGFDEYCVCNGYKAYQNLQDGSDQKGNIAAGTKTININLTGDYYFGLLVCGYDANITSAFTVNNVKIEY